MKKLVKRWIAGVSAAALLVSAVGFDAFTNVFLRSVSADADRGKTGKSTGFDDLEKDTDEAGNYNTGYGLHTNKTASIAEGYDDGRTFDVNLESWYVGENPVDVATILDASGSMAWTVDTLEPLEIDYKALEDIGINNKDALIGLQNQPENGGYLPQNVVDLILRPENTDNSKLSYNGYQYYIYDGRSSASEFVPLGYWDGTTTLNPTENSSLIGYYPFENSLKNEAPMKTGGTGTYIMHAEDNGGTFESAGTPVQPITPIPVTESGGSLDNDSIDLSETIKKGALLLDVNANEAFTIGMRIKSSVADSTHKEEFESVPLAYIGNETGTDYISLCRRGDTDARRIAVYRNGMSSDNRIINSEPTIFKDNNTKWNNVILSYDGNTLKLVVYNNGGDILYDGSTNLTGFNSKDLKIIIGEQLTEPTKPYSDMDMTAFCVFDKCLNDDEIGKLNNGIKELVDVKAIGDLTAYYGFTDGSLKNEVSAENGSLKYIEQGSKGSILGSELIGTDPATPTYASDHVSGSHSLNVTATSRLGSVLLDAAPVNDGNFTISFAIKHADKDHQQRNGVAEIMYLGNMDLSKNEYYHIARNWQLKKEEGQEKANGINDDRHLRFFNIGKEGVDDSAHVQKAFETTEWCTATFVVDSGSVFAYKNGKPDAEKYSGTADSLSADPINIIIAGLKDEYKGSDIYIDDLYVFNDALTAGQVNLYFGKELCDATTYNEDGSVKNAVYHAKNADGTEFAQINPTLYENTDAEARRGWYYVNSHSKWADIEGCLEGGKQYLGLINDPCLGEKETDPTKFVGGKTGEKVNLPEDTIENDNKSIATRPPGAPYADAIASGNDPDKVYDYKGDKERSIRFYVDQEGYLRCFFCTGDKSWKSSKVKDSSGKETTYWNYSPRTFCSLVYKKTPYDVDAKTGQATKYEQLNEALNQFYTALAKDSDLSNSAIVRFSTNNVGEKLDQLIMKDWTNWSEYYQNLPASEKTGKDEELKAKYMHDLLIPEPGETSTKTTTSAAQKIKEYPYVMTGGTYTWTGLKSFYDNMVDTTGKESGNRVYDIANDARDKYLIIFTDGRDNAIEQTDATNNSHKDNVTQAPEGETANTNSELAGLWADKLKEEGYTIFCVMMATGSISPTANPDEYNKAFDFLTTLAGGKETEKEIKKVEQQIKELDEIDPKYGGNKADLEKQIEEIKAANVIVADPTKEGSTTVEAFQNILKQIQQPRNDYTVQDYIDPRFDLIGKDADGNEVIYHLGAGGEVTFTDTNNTKLSQIQVAVPDGTKATLKSGDKANNIIDNIDKTDIVGLPYTPQDSYMVNRTDSSDMTGDGIGTGYLYYDDVKDMYYLRWTDQIIPMENEAFTTGENPTPDKKLDVWSATIRLKAKADFIGGNNILTNGNEAGENLVYSDATIENMDKNPNLYFTADKVAECTDPLTSEVNIPYRDKLERLSGTDRKINAVDAGGVSQAVYGDGIDIPSSGFPRTTVNVRLLKLDAKNLNDVIYMGEVISPTMMLADLENDYMTGSYYLEYLERYAYRVYGEKADNKPLLDLLNEWLKINNEKETEKTFTIPYMYLPDPNYKDDKLEKDSSGKVMVSNSSGATWDKDKNLDFTDPNLRDVTGFITYTWKRDDSSQEEQQKTGETNATGDPLYDITREYVVKNTEQIKYNLQLKFTPLQESALDGFSIDKEKFIVDKDNKPIDKFFAIDTNHEFTDKDAVDNELIAWTFTKRSDYLQAMVKEQHTYTWHIQYNDDQGKWKLSDKTIKETATNKDTYDWNSEYKPVVGSKQLENGKDNSIKGFYTDTPNNVNLLDVSGNSVTDDEGTIKDGSGAPISLAANTTYVKDVVNGALALELVVDGRYLKESPPKVNTDKTFTFDAVRYYDDPLDPLPYGETAGVGKSMNADTGEDGKKYKLTFKVDGSTLPTEPKENQIYTVWATLVEIKVDNGSDYISITKKATETNPYLGYTAKDALPIGTYVIQTVPDNETANNSLKNSQFYLGEDETGNAVHFKYLKLDKNSDSYKYNRFPESVYTVSENAATDANDPEYLIQNGATDNAPENIADSNRVKSIPGTDETQTLTFYLGTVETRKINGKNVANTKGYSKDDEGHSGENYIKDRLGIMLLSTDNNALTISKEVTNTNEKTEKYEERSWNFTITLTPTGSEWTDSTIDVPVKWYKLNEDGNWEQNTSIDENHPNNIEFRKTSESPIIYTASVPIKHHEKVVITDLPEGTWQVKEQELTDAVYTPHNNAIGDENWLYKKSNVTNTHDLQPNSSVDFINEFPYELPSAGGEGIDRYIFFGTMITVASVLLAAMLWHGRRKRRAR